MTRGKLARHPVDDAEGAQRVTLRRPERNPGIKADVGFAGDEQVVGEPRIGRGVLDDQGPVRREQRVGAEGLFAWRLAGFEAVAALEPLPVRIHEAHEGDGRVAGLAGLAREVVEGGFRRGIENLISTQGLQPGGFIGRENGGGHRGGGTRRDERWPFESRNRARDASVRRGLWGHCVDHQRTRVGRHSLADWHRRQRQGRACSRSSRSFDCARKLATLGMTEIWTVAVHHPATRHPPPTSRTPPLATHVAHRASFRLPPSDFAFCILHFAFSPSASRLLHCPAIGLQLLSTSRPA